jgi:hypothetical protein
VVGSTYATSGAGLFHYQDGVANSSFLSFNKSRGTSLGTQTILNNGDRYGGIIFCGSDGTAFIPSAQIDAQVDGTPGTNDMPGVLKFSTTADGASNTTEGMRINSNGAVLLGTTGTPTKAIAGSLTVRNNIFFGATNAGVGQIYTGTLDPVTATTGTMVFNFKMAAASNAARSAFVKLSITNRSSTNTASNSAVAEYWFQLFNNTSGVVSLNGATSIFQYTYVYATHFAFANLGSGESTVTLTNPTGVSLTQSIYKVEILTQAGAFYLDTVTVT